MENTIGYDEIDYANCSMEEYFDFEHSYVVKIDEENSLAHLDFGDRMKTIRIIKALTRQEVADKLGITEQEVIDVEKSKTKPTCDMIMELSNVLDIDIEFLYQGYRTPDPEPDERDMLILRLSNLLEEYGLRDW